MQWLGHVLRMDVHRVPRILLDGRHAPVGPGAGCGCWGETLTGMYYGRPGVCQRLVAEHLTERVYSRTSSWRRARRRCWRLIESDGDASYAVLVLTMAVVDFLNKTAFFSFSFFLFSLSHVVLHGCNRA